MKRLSMQEHIALAMAHDLRNPLSTLTNLSYLMEHKFEPRHVDAMKKQLVLCESIVNNLLEFAGMRKPHREEVVLPHLMEDVVGLMNVPSNVQVEIIPCEDISVWADPDQIRQAMINLIQNACEAFEKESGRIEICVFEQGESVCIDVRDNGPGIPEEIQEHVFEPFTTTKEHGLGLGLTSCKRIIEANKGKITARNVEPSGCVFSITLPRRLEP